MTSPIKSNLLFVFNGLMMIHYVCLKSRFVWWRLLASFITAINTISIGLIRTINVSQTNNCYKFNVSLVVIIE